MDRIARSLIIKGPLSLVGLAAGFLLTRTVLGGVAGLALSRLILLVGYDMRSPAWLARREDLRGPAGRVALSRARWDWAALGQLTWLSLPLGVTTMLISLNTNLPRYFLESHSGAYELGIFAALAYLFVAGSTVVSALAQSASPRLAKYYASRDVYPFRRLLVRLVAIGLLLGSAAVLVALVAGRQILTILYEAEYARYVEVLLWLTLAYALSYAASFLGVGMTAARYFRVQPVVFGLLTAVTLLLSFLLIPQYGLYGAAWATIATNAFQFLAAFAVIAHAIRRLRVSQ
jgi:O-antigen/teichoic acid export membrane protein